METKLNWVGYFVYLDTLRESGQTNMFGAREYLLEDFSELDDYTAKKVLMAWMKTFSNDKTPEERVKMSL